MKKNEVQQWNQCRSALVTGATKSHHKLQHCTRRRKSIRSSTMASFVSRWRRYDVRRAEQTMAVASLMRDMLPVSFVQGKHFWHHRKKRKACRTSSWGLSEPVITIDGEKNQGKAMLHKNASRSVMTWGVTPWAYIWAFFLMATQVLYLSKGYWYLAYQI